MASKVIEIILQATDQASKIIASLGKTSGQTSQQIDNLGKSGQSAAKMFQSFDTSSKSAWNSLLGTQRAAGATASELGKLAQGLGVASKAEIEAKLKMDQLIAAWNKGEISSEKLTEELNNLDSASKDASKDVSGLSNVSKMLASTLSVGAVVQIAKAAWELGELGAQSKRTSHAFEMISGGAVKAEANLNAMRTATRGAMSQQEMMANANLLMQMGLAKNSNELGQMTNMAVRLGKAMGSEAGASIQNFSMMLANQSLPRLDTFGISSGKVRERILELQAATEGMTRETAFMQAVMEEGGKAMERLGEDVDDEALAFERLDVVATDLKTLFAEELAPATSGVAGAVADLGDKIVTSIRQLNEYKKVLGEVAVQEAETTQALDTLADASAVLTGDMVATTDAAYDEGAVLDELGRKYDALVTGPANDLMNAQLHAANYFRDTALATDEAAIAQEGLATAASKVADSFGEMEFDNESLWELALASGASLEQLGPLAEQLGIASDAEVQATIEAYKLAESFGAGALSAKDYRAEMAKTKSDLQDLEHYAGLAAGKVAAALGAGVRGPHEGPSATRRQHGGAASGLTLVGEAGPEALYMPPGSYVHSNQSSTTQNYMDQRTYNRTNHIGTELALALEANRAQQEQRTSANMLM